MEVRFKVLAIIPARSGSKGVPNKNTIVFQGKSLIQYAVDCAVESKKIDKILINSDSEKILNSVDKSIESKRIIKQLRPQNLGLDNSSIVDVAIHAIDQIKERYDVVILLQVTSPLRTSNDIDSIIRYFEEDDKLEGVISVIPVSDMHPARMYKLEKKDYLCPLNINFETQHRQDLKNVYLRNGCFYAVRTEVLKKQKTFMPTHKKAYIMNPEHLLNIDSPRDVLIGKALIEAWQNNNL